ncbi:MAG TPA: hypothetical protein VJP81_05185 [Candidatus Dormibacteraeota bacterium]|nr:hypothetical protein [Candidatus Dormibacteraeota bacterium]
MLVRGWEGLAAEQPLAALTASHALHRALAGWQVDLVKVAVANGSSWEEVGSALETTKQAAWSRFRHAVGEQGGDALTDIEDRRQARRRAKEVWARGQERLREMDARWHEEQKRLLQRVREGKDALAEAKARHQRERRAARQALAKEVKGARTSA